MPLVMTDLIPSRRLRGSRRLPTKTNLKPLFGIPWLSNPFKRDVARHQSPSSSGNNKAPLANDHDHLRPPEVQTGNRPQIKRKRPPRLPDELEHLRLQVREEKSQWKEATKRSQSGNTKLKLSQNCGRMTSIAEVGDDVHLIPKDGRPEDTNNTRPPGKQIGLSLLERAPTALQAVAEESEDTESDVDSVVPRALEDVDVSSMPSKPTRSLRRVVSYVNLKSRCDSPGTLTRKDTRMNSVIYGLATDGGADDQDLSPYRSMASAAKILLDLSHIETPEVHCTVDFVALELDATRSQLLEALRDIDDLNAQLLVTQEMLKKAVEDHNEEVDYLHSLLNEAREESLILRNDLEDLRTEDFGLQRHTHIVNEKLLWPLRSQIAHSDCESAWSSNLATPQLTPASPLKAQLTVEDAGDERVEHGTDLGDIEQVRDLSDSPKIPPVSSQLTPFESSPKICPGVYAPLESIMDICLEDELRTFGVYNDHDSVDNEAPIGQLMKRSTPLTILSP